MRFSLTLIKKPVMTSSALRVWTLTTERGPAGGAYGAGGFDFGDLGDIFGSFFGGGFGSAQRRNPNAPQRGESIRLSVTISFEEAAFGCEKEVSVDRYETCAVCHGSGCADGTSPEVCPDCHGSGQVQVRRQTPMGVFGHHLSLRPMRRQGPHHQDPLYRLPGQRLRAQAPHHSG